MQVCKLYLYYFVLSLYEVFGTLSQTYLGIKQCIEQYLLGLFLPLNFIQLLQIQSIYIMLLFWQNIFTTLKIVFPELLWHPASPVGSVTTLGTNPDYDN